jgi:hypothetical protein
MATLFVLLNAEDGGATTSGETLTPEKLTQAAELLTVFVNRYVSKYWGVPGGCVVRAGTSPTDIQENEWPLHIRATIPEAPDAIAYHTVNGLGVPDLEDGLDLSDTLFGPGGALSAWGHEIGESIVDPGTNRLDTNADSTQGFAEEVADPVEMQSFSITLPDGTAGYLPNIVLPTYFIPNHAGPYDLMTAEGLQDASAGPPAPLTCAPGAGGNYQVVYTSLGTETQVTAMGDPSHREARKRHPSSRAYRRGLRLPEKPKPEQPAP